MVELRKKTKDLSVERSPGRNLNCDILDSFLYPIVLACSLLPNIQKILLHDRGTIDKVWIDDRIY